jgi:hypothetical protein
VNRTLGFIIFFTVAMTVLGGIHYLFWARLIRDTALPTPWKAIATATIIALGLSIPASLFLGRTLSFEAGRPLMLVTFLWMGLIVLLFPLVVGSDILRLLAALGGYLTGHGAVLESPERRQFVARIIAGGALLAAGGLAGLGLVRGLGPITVRRVEVTLSRLPRRLTGFTIVQITDLHIGQTRGERWVRQVVDQVNALEPDLIAVTGDLVEGTPERLRREVAPLADLSARLGSYFVTGNHDYFSGWEPWQPALERLGFRVLRNESVPIEIEGNGFDLAGVDDHEAAQFGAEAGQGTDLERTLADRDPEREVILLAHQPRAVDEAAAHDVGLVLSGHTHGGQIWPWMHMVGLQQPYISGLHRHGERTQIYVSEGTGYWGPPMRVGSRCEITHIVLRGEA